MIHWTASVYVIKFPFSFVVLVIWIFSLPKTSMVRGLLGLNPYLYDNSLRAFLSLSLSTHWHQAHTDLPVTASQVVQLKASATTTWQQIS